MVEFKVKIFDHNLGARLEKFNIDPALNSGIRKSIFVLHGEALKRVPVDSGKLKTSHYKKFENLFGALGTKLDYAGYVHFGTINQRAQPWLQESLENKEREILNIFERELDYTINKI